MESSALTLNQWVEHHKAILDLIFGSAGIIAAIITLLYNTTRRNSLDKKRYALDIMKGWNENTTTTTSKLRHKYRDKYNKCQKIDLDDITNYVNESDENADNVIRLLNYFEFIATSCRHKAVNRKMINAGFSVTMFRYTVLLIEYLLNQKEKTNRNPWKPLTEYIISLVNKNKIKCNKECKLCPKKTDSIFVKNLITLNS